MDNEKLANIADCLFGERIDANLTVNSTRKTRAKVAQRKSVCLPWCFDAEIWHWLFGRLERSLASLQYINKQLARLSSRLCFPFPFPFLSLYCEASVSLWEEMRWDTEERKRESEILARHLFTVRRKSLSLFAWQQKFVGKSQTNLSWVNLNTKLDPRN